MNVDPVTARYAGALYGLVAVDMFEASSKKEPCGGCVERLDRVLELSPKHGPALEAKRILGRR